MYNDSKRNKDKCDECVKFGQCRKRLLESMLEYDDSEGLAITQVMHHLMKMGDCPLDARPLPAK